MVATYFLVKETGGPPSVHCDQLREQICMFSRCLATGYRRKRELACPARSARNPARSHLHAFATEGLLRCPARRGGTSCCSAQPPPPLSGRYSRVPPARDGICSRPSWRATQSWPPGSLRLAGRSNGSVHLGRAQRLRVSPNPNRRGTGNKKNPMVLLEDARAGRLLHPRRRCDRLVPAPHVRPRTGKHPTPARGPGYVLASIREELHQPDADAV